MSEFGLLLLPMCLFLVGSLDMGMEIYYKSVLQGAVNDIARSAIVESPNFTGDASMQLEDKIKAAIKERVGTLVPNPTWDIKLTSYYDFTGAKKPERYVDTNKNGKYDKGECFTDSKVNNVYDTDTSSATRGGADDVVFYEVNMKTARVLPVAKLFGASGNYDLTVQTAVRNQPYSDRAAPKQVCT
ncbi:TadE/TadG family type IV pilus assembly protein [Allosphingosinicella deserti]|nr:TadE/TadG family type IV pilus assembly protein [Sphingomonas deserti]